MATEESCLSLKWALYIIKAEGILPSVVASCLSGATLLNPPVSIRAIH